MNFLQFFAAKPCPVCAEKEAMIRQLREDLSRDRLRTSVAVEREHAAMDRLLGRQGELPITPPKTMGTKEGDEMMKDAFAIFTDEEDHGDGKIREVDRLDHDGPGQK